MLLQLVAAFVMKEKRSVHGEDVIQRGAYSVTKLSNTEGSMPLTSPSLRNAAILQVIASEMAAGVASPDRLSEYARVLQKVASEIMAARSS